ncbi:hypothetical protein AVEN_258922-1 [Araneus ventricosus]|uniref:Uncharacterized protein n=1 Tax=Araneus ventricosus TaxID=182803 RepID=A0A4Y2CEC1_ARAVE|nr:hypothetical protein AVEN_258922-1 [Araneus ventricosus]
MCHHSRISLVVITKAVGRNTGESKNMKEVSLVIEPPVLQHVLDVFLALGRQPVLDEEASFVVHVRFQLAPEVASHHCLGGLHRLKRIQKERG